MKKRAAPSPGPPESGRRPTFAPAPSGALRRFGRVIWIELSWPPAPHLTRT